MFTAIFTFLPTMPRKWSLFLQYISSLNLNRFPLLFVAIFLHLSFKLIYLLAEEVVAYLAKNFRGAGLLLEHLNKRFKLEAFLK